MTKKYHYPFINRHDPNRHLMLESCRENKWIHVRPYDSYETRSTRKLREEEVYRWLEKNCKGKYFDFGLSIFFENPEDATLAMLSWP